MPVRVCSRRSSSRRRRRRPTVALDCQRRRVSPNQRATGDLVEDVLTTPGGGAHGRHHSEPEQQQLSELSQGSAQLDPAATATAASLINTTDDGAVDVLVRLEANAAARAFRVTVRSPSPAAAAAFKNVLQALLTSYFAV